MRLLSMSVGLSATTSEARRPAPYATLSAALYLRPGAACRKRQTSSGLSTTGSFRGWGTNGKWATASGLRSVTMKRKRSAVRPELMRAALAPFETRCS